MHINVSIRIRKKLFTLFGLRNILINVQNIYIYKSLPLKNLNTKKSPSLCVSSLLVKTEAGEAVSPALRGVG